MAKVELTHFSGSHTNIFQPSDIFPISIRIILQAKGLPLEHASTAVRHGSHVKGGVEDGWYTLHVRCSRKLVISCSRARKSGS